MGLTISMSGKILMLLFVKKHVSRSVSKLSVKSKQHNAKVKYWPYAKFDFYTNDSGWVRNQIFNKIVKQLEVKIKKTKTHRHSLYF